MMTLLSRIPLLLAALALLAAPPSAPAQDAGIAAAYDQAVAALERNDPAAGLKIVDTVIDKFGASGKDRFGPAFGHFHYLKGMLLIRQEHISDAIAQLRIAYEDYPNEGRESGQAPNVFRTHALMQWGLCLQALEQYENAREKFELALAEDTGREPRINRVALEMNLARCYMRTGREEEGQKILRGILGDQGIDADTIQNAFTVLAADGEESLDIMGVVRENAGALFGTEEDREVMNPRLASLGSRALHDGQPLQALVWFNLITLPRESLERNFQRRLELQERRKAALEQDRKDIAAKIDETLGTLVEMEAETRKNYENALLGMAAAHFQIGNTASALAIYQTLESRFPAASDRAGLLHNLTLCSTQLELWNEAATYAEKFFAEFPDNEMGVAISRVLAQVSFMRQDFEAALGMAREARAAFEPGAPDRESFDFIVAASLHQTGDYETADRELQSYLKNYPDGENVEPVRFFLAAGMVRLSLWLDAIPLLDAFNTDYPESPYRPQALYFASLAYLITEQPYEALIRINWLLSQHPRSDQAAAGFNVRGDIQTILGEPYDAVTASYLQAKTRSRSLGDPGLEVAAYAIKQLIATAVTATKYDEALTFFADFEKSHAASIWRTPATVSAAEAHAGLEQVPQGRSLLETLVTESLDSSTLPFEEAFQAYRDFLSRNETLQDRLAALRDFPGAETDPLLRGWVTLAAIEALESSPDPDPAQLQSRFEALLADFREHGAALAASPRVRLAQWLATERSDPKTARTIYESVVTQEASGEALGRALVELAKLDAQSSDSSRLDAAERDLQRVRNEFDNPVLHEEAVLELARLTTKRERWEDATALWATYMDAREWKEARAEASFGYAESLERQNQREEALKGYINVYANFPGKLDWSTEAYLRSATILWNTGRNRDALVVLQEMLRTMEGLTHPNIARAEQLFFTWRDEFAAAANR